MEQCNATHQSNKKDVLSGVRKKRMFFFGGDNKHIEAHFQMHKLEKSMRIEKIERREFLFHLKTIVYLDINMILLHIIA